MLVGEVRIATTGSGSSWMLSGHEPAGVAADEAVEVAPVQQARSACASLAAGRAGSAARAAPPAR